MKARKTYDGEFEHATHYTEFEEMSCYRVIFQKEQKLYATLSFKILKRIPRHNVGKKKYVMTTKLQF